MPMGYRKMGLMNLSTGWYRHMEIQTENKLVDTVGEGKDGTNWENSTETYALFHSETYALFHSETYALVHSVHFQLFGSSWTAAHQASLFITNSKSLLKLMYIELVMTSNHFILPLLYPSLPAFNQISQFFTSGGQSIGVFSFNISPSKEYSGLISFRMDWLDLLAV